MRKIAIAGAGIFSAQVTKLVAERGIQPIESNDLENLNPHREQFGERYFALNNPAAEVERALAQRKLFICKGKHQYRETKGVWQCQCGRKL